MVTPKLFIAEWYDYAGVRHSRLVVGVNNLAARDNAHSTIEHSYYGLRLSQVTQVDGYRILLKEKEDDEW